MTDDKSWLEKNALLVVTVLAGVATLILGLMLSGVFSSDDTEAVSSSTEAPTTTSTTQAAVTTTTAAPSTMAATTTTQASTMTAAPTTTTTAATTTTTAPLPDWIIDTYSLEVGTPFAFDLDTGTICEDSSCGAAIDIVVNYNVFDDGSMSADFQVDNSATLAWVQSGQTDDCDPSVVDLGFEPRELFIGNSGIPSTGMCVYTTDGNMAYTYIEYASGPTPKLIGVLATWPGFGQ